MSSVQLRVNRCVLYSRCIVVYDTSARPIDRIKRPASNNKQNCINRTISRRV